MKTPICDFVERYIKSGAARLHMPGHKGINMLGIEERDITEIDGADVLYSSNGIIRESEKNAEALFGTARTVYSAEGSSLSIRAMLCLAVMHAREMGKRPIIAAGRNAHKVFVSTAALLDFEVEWIYSTDGSLISCDITADSLAAALDEMTVKPTALYITSPDYLGNIVSIKGIAEVCHKRGMLLLVDNAHGAYLGFLPESMHPIMLGADMSADSAHKTLPVLTGGGYLQISKTAPAMLAERAEYAMSLFASTSPSYLILQSLDAANRYLSDGYRERLVGFIKKLDTLRAALIRHGFTLIGNEPLKLTLAPKFFGYTGCELADILAENGIVCEFSDPDYTVMMPTPEQGERVLADALRVLTSLKPRAAIVTLPPKLGRPSRAMTPREATFSPCESVKIEDAHGRILASAQISCPPAIPIAVCGEVIDGDVIAALGYYAVGEVTVTK
ncbi:MAG: aminotransferase class V-fold PLP-dependent enzyme [Clostridia bacterium]|nr:aminotransferase class V-fold PLP-dependent enzyme [Clostridia bacterium]